MYCKSGMKILFVVTSPASFAAVHQYAVALIKECKRKQHEISAVFFTAQSVVLLSKNHEETSGYGELRTAYIRACKDVRTDILCCGQAIRNCGFAYGDLDGSVKIAGNMELSVQIAQADLVLEF